VCSCAFCGSECLVTVNTKISDADFLAQVDYQTTKIGEVFLLRDEQAVSECHMRNVLLECIRWIQTEKTDFWWKVVAIRNHGIHSLLY
jgi:hypothetical protein